MAKPGKEVMNRIETPDQLDEFLRFKSTKSWLALASMTGIVTLAVIWGIFGEVQTKVEGTAILLSEGGLFQIVAKEPGHLQECKVRSGDIIQKKQIVAVVSNPQLQNQISIKQAEIDSIRASRFKQSQLILAKTDAQKRVFETQRLQLIQRKVFIERRLRALDERVRTYEELLKEGAATRQAYLNAKLEYEKAVEEGATVDTELNEAILKRRELEATVHDQLFQLKFKLSLAEGELNALQKKMDLTTSIRSDFHGRVIEVLARQGQRVQEGQPIVTCDRALTELEVEIFVPAAEGKKILPGMTIQVAPSTVQREEYGFMTGKVSSVDIFPISRDALLSWLKNDKLVDSVMQKGPLLSVLGSLDRDPSTKSGFHWSSLKGADVELTAGTMGTAEVVVSKQPPAALVLPAIKKWLGI
ncbi:MAG: NHLP bacteriocin system secretion protein [Desulfomonile sp.]